MQTIETHCLRYPDLVWLMLAIPLIRKNEQLVGIIQIVMSLQFVIYSEQLVNNVNKTYTRHIHTTQFPIRSLYVGTFPNVP